MDCPRRTDIGEKEVSKINCAQVLVALLAVLGFGPQSRATDITGAVTVPKPDQAVVYVETIAGTFRGERVKMGQQNKVFLPYVLPVVKGATVEFQNSDDLEHNVFGVGADEFNLGNWTKGIVREHSFDKLGDVIILCNVHKEMEAHVLVLQNPYFARLDNSGNFRIANVPPGDYVVKLWYRGKVKKQSVKAPATGSITVEF